MLTIEQVEKETTTPRKALELSIKHWWENYCLTKKKLERLEIKPIASNSCGLCVFYGHPYKNEGYKSCIASGCKVRPTCLADRSLYTKAKNAFYEFKIKHSEENYQAWRKAAKSMHKYLCSLR